SFCTWTITTKRGHTYPKMRRCRGLFRRLELSTRTQFLADYIISTLGFDLRQGQAQRFFAPIFFSAAGVLTVWRTLPPYLQRRGEGPRMSCLASSIFISGALAPKVVRQRDRRPVQAIKPRGYFLHAHSCSRYCQIRCNFRQRDGNEALFLDALGGEAEV